MKKFTLIELLVVVSIIGILASILMPALGQARRKSKAALCLSNHRQINTAVHIYLTDSDDYFPFAAIPGMQPNTGRFWVGKAGWVAESTADVTERPINLYLGYEEDGTEVPIVLCPLSDERLEYEGHGSSYMAQARNEYEDDLDTQTSSVKIDSIYQPVKMVMFGEVGGFHYSQNGQNPWSAQNMWHVPGKPVYSFSYIDGHADVQSIYETQGLSTDNKVINFRNF